jgi:hypothetical protein
MFAKARRNEASPPGIDVPVAGSGLLMRIEALGHDEIEFILGARHRDVKQAAFFLDLFARAGGHIGRNAAIDDIEDKDRLPFLPFRRMDRRQDQIVFVEQGLSGLVARGLRRVERKIG